MGKKRKVTVPPELMDLYQRLDDAVQAWQDDHKAWITLMGGVISVTDVSEIVTSFSAGLQAQSWQHIIETNGYSDHARSPWFIVRLGRTFGRAFGRSVTRYYQALVDEGAPKEMRVPQRIVKVSQAYQSELF
jgi:hypothetical protein